MGFTESRPAGVSAILYQTLLNLLIDRSPFGNYGRVTDSFRLVTDSFRLILTQILILRFFRFLDMAVLCAV